MAESSKIVPALTNAERFPLIADFSHLNNLKQDSFAPKFNFKSGDRLQQHHLETVHAYANKIRFGKEFWKTGFQPSWLDEYLRWCIRTVDFYKNRKEGIQYQPTIAREDLRIAPWKFVSSDCKLDDLLVYQTSGTTKVPVDVIFDPASQVCWIPQLESILDSFKIQLTRGSKATAIALICAQNFALTYASLSTYLEGAGILKINLKPGEWHDASHRLKYLEKFNPEILTGDPFAFHALLELQPKIKPKALVSSAMKLSDGLKKKLEAYFQCPVLDIYSLTECRMIAVAESTHRHRAIRHDLYLEIFDKDKDVALPHGEHGELVITGGNNAFLPLIRYRTGDFCSLRIEDGIPYLFDLEARKPVAFYRHDRVFVNYIDISRVLAPFPLAGYNLHQDSDKHIQLTAWSNEPGIAENIAESLATLFGKDCRISITIHPVDTASGKKPMSFTSAFSQ